MWGTLLYLYVTCLVLKNIIYLFVYYYGYIILIVSYHESNLALAISWSRQRQAPSLEFPSLSFFVSFHEKLYFHS